MVDDSFQGLGPLANFQPLSPESEPAKPDPAGSGDTEEHPRILALPTWEHYRRVYANTSGGNEKKAVKLFKEFESADKVRRLRQEMYSLSKGWVPEEACERILGKSRRVKFGEFKRYGQVMLGFVNSQS